MKGTAFGGAFRVSKKPPTVKTQVKERITAQSLVLREKVAKIFDF